MTVIRTLEIGSLRLPLHARHTLRQSYDTLGGRYPLRFSDGSLLVQQSWAKLRTTIEGEGTVPPGLASLDTTSSQTLKCVGKRSVAGTTSITLPAGRRTDTGSTPCAYAQVGDAVVETSLSIVANVATLTAVANADVYWVDYYPEISVICDPVKEQLDVNGAVIGWTLTAEEV